MDLWNQMSNNIFYEDYDDEKFLINYLFWFIRITFDTLAYISSGSLFLYVGAASFSI